MVLFRVWGYFILTPSEWFFFGLEAILYLLPVNGSVLGLRPFYTYSQWMVLFWVWGYFIFTPSEWFCFGFEAILYLLLVNGSVSGWRLFYTYS